jgi:hypothetical protein
VAHVSAAPFTLNAHQPARAIDRGPVPVVCLGALLENLKRDIQLAHRSERACEAPRQLSHLSLRAAGCAGARNRERLAQPPGRYPSAVKRGGISANRTRERFNERARTPLQKPD